MASMSTQRVMFCLLAVVVVAVIVLSSSINLTSQKRTSLGNGHRLHATNIHRLGWRREQMATVDFNSGSYVLKDQPDTQLNDHQDVQRQPDYHGDNLPDDQLGDYADSYSSFFEFTNDNTSSKEDNRISDKTTNDNTSSKEDNVMLFKTPNELQNKITLPKLIPKKSRPYSPGKQKIMNYIKRFDTELKTKFMDMIGEYNKLNKIPFQSLQSGQMWYVFTEIMRSLGYEQRLPRVINIGVKKSGTTALGFFISQHPQIAHSFGNEVHFFDKPTKTKLGMEYYRSRMGFSNKHQLAFEKTPRYFITQTAPKDIFNQLPKDIKFILCVRDPVKRAISEYHHDMEYMLRRNKKTELKVAKQRSPDEQGKLFAEQFINSQGHVHRNKTTIKTSIYSLHFKNWLKTFPRERFLIINLDKLTKNTYAELKRVEKFLNLEPFYTPNMVVQSKKRGSCLKINGWIKCPGRSTPGFTNKAKLNSRAERILYDFYRPYNQEFARLTGEQFNWMNM